MFSLTIIVYISQGFMMPSEAAACAYHDMEVKTVERRAVKDTTRQYVPLDAPSVISVTQYIAMTRFKYFCMEILYPCIT